MATHRNGMAGLQSNRVLERRMGTQVSLPNQKEETPSTKKRTKKEKESFASKNHNEKKGIKFHLGIRVSQ